MQEKKIALNFISAHLSELDTRDKELISNAKAVSIVTSTTGWEAVLRNIPVISFTDNIWDIMKLSKKCSEIENLSIDIINEVEKIKNINQLEKKKRIVCYIAAILQNSFEITFPNILVYTEVGTEEQYDLLNRGTLKTNVQTDFFQ